MELFAYGQRIIFYIVLTPIQHEGTQNNSCYIKQEMSRVCCSCWPVSTSKFISSVTHRLSFVVGRFIALWNNGRPQHINIKKLLL